MNSDICSHLPLHPAWSCCFPVFRDAAIHHHVTPCRHLWNMTKFKRGPPPPYKSCVSWDSRSWQCLSFLFQNFENESLFISFLFQNFGNGISINISYFRPFLFLPSSWLSRQPLPSCPQFIEAWCCLRFTFWILELLKKHSFSARLAIQNFVI